MLTIISSYRKDVQEYICYNAIHKTLCRPLMIIGNCNYMTFLIFIMDFTFILPTHNILDTFIINIIFFFTVVTFETVSTINVTVYNNGNVLTTLIKKHK